MREKEIQNCLLISSPCTVSYMCIICFLDYSQNLFHNTLQSSGWPEMRAATHEGQCIECLWLCFSDGFQCVLKPFLRLGFVSYLSVSAPHISMESSTDCVANESTYCVNELINRVSG